MSVISWPDLPHFLNSATEPNTFSCAFWSCASCWPFVSEAGNGSPCILRSSGLLSKVSRCEGPPAMQRWMIRFARIGKCGLPMTPRPRSVPAPWASAPPDSMPSAIPPSP